MAGVRHGPAPPPRLPDDPTAAHVFSHPARRRRHPLSTLIAGYLRKNDYEVDTVLHGDAAVPAILSIRPDLVILDVNLPGKDGFEICREARKQYDGVIIMVTARDEPFDELLGLEFGADDYVHKPVEPRILLARIKAQLRRAPRA